MNVQEIREQKERAEKALPFADLQEAAGEMEAISGQLASMSSEVSGRLLAGYPLGEHQEHGGYQARTKPAAIDPLRVVLLERYSKAVSRLNSAVEAVMRLSVMDKSPLPPEPPSELPEEKRGG